MKARFVGRDGSLGYREGQVYDLAVSEQGKYVLITSPRFCPYASWKDFFDNWERVLDRQPPVR